MESPELTQFAQKYGPRDGQRESGLSPLEYSFPRQVSEDEKESNILREEFQRNKLYEFTTRELVQLDVISDQKLKGPNLQNGIIPMLGRDRWESQPPQPSFTRNYLYSLWNGRGLWSSENPEVWRVLEPCLRLASRILLSLNTLPWVKIPPELLRLLSVNTGHSSTLS